MPSAGVFERLADHLRATARRWEHIVQPLVLASDRELEEILFSSSHQERPLAVERILRLAGSAPAERKALIEKELRSRPASEMELWTPGLLVQTTLTSSLDSSALLVDAWLDWAEALGRKDALLLAASYGIHLISLRKDSKSVLEVATLWADLPPVEHGVRGRATLLDMYADCLRISGEPEKSLSVYRSARRLFEEARDHVGQANTYVGEADVLLQLGQIENSLAAYRTARKFFENAWEGLGQGNTYLGEAYVLFRLGKNEESLAAYRRAREFYEQMRDRLGQGNTYMGEADVLDRLGKTDEALLAYRRARKFFEEEGNRLGQGSTYKGEADVLFRLGRNEESLAANRSARKFFEEVRDSLGQGSTYTSEAHVLLLLGQNEKSLAAYRNARKLSEEGRGLLGQGNTYEGEAEVLFQLGENDKSLVAYRNARKLYGEAGDHGGQGNTYRGEADVLLRMGQNEQSLAAYRNARRLFQEVGDPLGEGNAYQGEARVLLRRGEGRKAADLAAQAIERLRKTGDVSDERDAWLVRAEAQALSGSPESAATAAEEAIRLHERWRTTLITEAHRVQEDEAISAAYDVLVPIRLGQGRVAEGLARAEEARSHVLLDLLAPRPAHREGDSAIDLLAERQRLESELAQVETQSHQGFDPGRQEELRERRHRLDRDLEWNSYLRIAAEKDVLPVARSLDAAAIQALAGETGPILLYYAADKKLIGFLVLPGASEIFTARIEVPRRRLAERVREFAHDEANPVYANLARRPARELWDLLIGPFANRLPTSGPLVLVPHGPLHELPFEALLDPSGSPLFLRWEVSVAPSVSSLALARDRHKEASHQDSFLAFSSGQGLDLPEEEAGEIARLFDENQATFRPIEARFESYERLVTKARHLLIATNGAHAQGSRRDTYLEIEPTRDVHDSRLSAAEISALPLQAELVTLAACDTARGEALLSDERLDLTRAFLIAGAASVLATRWKVPESQATSGFLLDFYRSYRAGGPDGSGLRKDRALAEARRQSRERGDPAQVWAAWVLVGDPR
jgi:CHAT domain-containing protein/tetratricopeptide (TPR) repeat protein